VAMPTLRIKESRPIGAASGDPYYVLCAAWRMTDVTKE
jgi:hypothetical protein